MDANELADILHEPNGFQVPHETENEAANIAEEAEDADDEDFEPEEDKEDILLEADDDDGEEEDN